MKNISREKFNVSAAIGVWGKEELQTYLDKVLAFQQQCQHTTSGLNESEEALSISATASYEVKYTISFLKYEYKCSYEELLFILLIATIHARKDELAFLLFKHIKTVVPDDLKILLFGIMSLSNKAQQEPPLGKIFHELLERFSNELTNENIFDLVIYAVHLELTEIVRSLAQVCAKRTMMRDPSVLDFLIDRKIISNRYYAIRCRKNFFDMEFLHLNVSKTLLNPLQMAAFVNNIAMVTILLEAGANDMTPDPELAEYGIQDAFTSVYETRNDEMLALFLSQGCGVFRTLEKSKLESILKGEVDRVPLLGCTVTVGGKSVKFEHSKAITTLEELKKVPVTSKEDIKLFERWYTSICHAQTNVLTYKGFGDHTEILKETEAWKFEILRSISRKSPASSLVTHCLFAINHNIFKQTTMQELKKLTTPVLFKLGKFPYVDPKRTEEQFFILLWKDYLHDCDNENISALNTYIVNLAAERKKCTKAAKKYIDEIVNKYTNSIKNEIFSNVFRQLRKAVLDNVKKNLDSGTSDDQCLFNNSLAILGVEPPKFNKNTSAEKKKTWLENLKNLLTSANNCLLYFLIKEAKTDAIDFKIIQVKRSVKKFFEYALNLEIETDVSEKIVSFFSSTLLVYDIKKDFQKLKDNFDNFYQKQQSTLS